MPLDPADKNARFRLGVAHRMRHESAGRRPGDFQAAIDAWGRARKLDPNQYIWRRRIEQYGPGLAKPYAFYDWVVPAKAEISRRGETPVPLTVEPYGSELVGPCPRRPCRGVGPIRAGSEGPDPPGTSNGSSRPRWSSCWRGSAPARPLRVHLTFRPVRPHKARWNNESTPLRVWVAGAEGWTIASRLLECAAGRPARVG